MKRAFTLEYWQDDGWYVGKLREVPGVFSQGETLKELEDYFDHKLEKELAPIRTDQAVQKWMIGVLLAGVLSLVLKAFFKPYQKVMTGFQFDREEANAR